MSDAQQQQMVARIHPATIDLLGGIRDGERMTLKVEGETYRIVLSESEIPGEAHLEGWGILVIDDIQQA